MNGFELESMGLKKLIADGKIEDTPEVQRQIELNDILASFSDKDFCTVFNSGCFNDILKSYIRTALKNCEVNEEDTTRIMNEVRWLLDTKQAEEII